METAFNTRDPVYLQVVRLFKERIVTGLLAAGEAIPSRREIASLLKMNPNTAQRAYKEMEEQGLIVTEGNSPSRITRDEDVLRNIRSELLGEAVRTFMGSIRNMQVPLQEIVALVQEEYESDAQRRARKPGGEGA
ncbi:GntR family transcriptional regulator [Cohnella ginsengisoli]|uniref:GntR family transcriptional regulator n=1 Tax=Cohnella ginsengisoli TaxID=425004 RepID=A0A9X4KK48_9BACL|nr:GntR family transcriptional regulator [Cohnella ginsengisoli]MDG0793722.1 GntR family transcriptional regulator [Cohnella ginsengisoli]